ncbi:hypothetical protein [Kaarinaea lacus]
MLKFYIAVVLIFFSTLGHATAQPQCFLLAKLEKPPSSRSDTKNIKIPYPQVDSAQVVQVFKKAVERGELKLFEMTVAYSALKPQHVEYTYRIGEKEPTVKVYSLLTKPMPLPEMPDILIEGVTVILDINGQILEAIAHCHH